MTADTLIRAVRDALGDLAASLTDEEWRHPSLCPGWRVHDVVAHCVQSHVATPGKVLRELVAAGFSLDRRNERWVAARRALPPARILAEYRETATRLDVPAAEARFALVEAVVHGLDVALPLGRTLELPEEALVAVADTYRHTQFLLGGRKRCAGLTFRASDVEWNAGDGPVVTGPLAALVLAAAGRPAALGELGGEGLSVLRERFAQS